MNITDSIFLYTEPLPPGGSCFHFGPEAQSSRFYGVEVYTGIRQLPFWRRLKLSWRIFTKLMGYRPIRRAL